MAKQTRVEKTLEEVMKSFAALRAEHTHDRDAASNYGCYNVEDCRNCNFVYNSRGCMSCHNGDGLIECVQCVDCRDCAFCVGLQGARFHFLNKECSELEYYNKMRLYGIEWEVHAMGDDLLDPIT